MPTFTTFDNFWQDLGRKKHDLNADVIKVMLTNTAPNPTTDTVKADIVEIAAGNGYTAGGTQLTTNSWSQTGGTAKLTGDDVVFTAAGGSMAAFRYAVLYNDTATGDALIGYVDHGAGITLTTGQSYTFDVDATNGLLQVAG